MNDKKNYRPNVGIAVFNKQGKVLVCKWDTNNWDNSSKKYCWQMPQGGIDGDETPLEAAYREIKEEANIDPTSLKLLKQSAQACRYDFPKDRKGTTHTGQEQTWIAFEFLGDDSEISVINCPDPCFVKWRWEELSETLNLIVPFKRKSYEFMVSEFEALF